MTSIYFHHVSLLPNHTPQAPSNRALSARGLKINLNWGDFVECGYPFMSRDSVVMYSAHVGAALGGALVG